MKQIDILAARPQPTTPTYSTEELVLSPRWTRALYFAATGKQAPPYNPAKQIKRWADSTAALMDPLRSIEYLAMRRNGQGQMEFAKFLISAADAAVFNLPGAYAYEKYIVKPTTAFVQEPNGTRTPINPDFLSSPGDASIFAHEIGADEEPKEEALTGPFVYYYPPEELRRPYTVKFKGTPIQVSFFLKQQNERGIGSPGRWDLTGPAPIWITAVPDTGAMDNRPEIEMPVRPLDTKTEEIRCTPFGCAVYRIDGPAEPGAGAALTKADHEQLDRIEANTAAVLEIMKPLSTT